VIAQALRDISEGEELHNSYNQCNDCDSRRKDYGTPEIFQDYGFVESYPQRWVFPLRRLTPLSRSRSKVVSFDLDLDDNQELMIFWNRDPPAGALVWLKGQLKRLKKVGKLKLEKQDASILDQEWDAIKKYYDALVVAFTKAVDALESARKECKENECTLSGICDVSGLYKLLSIENEKWHHDWPVLCDFHEIYSPNHWHTKEGAQSYYQKISFHTIPNFGNNICLDLSGTVQVVRIVLALCHVFS